METVRNNATKSSRYFLFLITVVILFSSGSSFARRGGSHTSSGGDFIRNPTTDAAINAFLNNPNQWAQLVWLQKTLIDDLQYLMKSNLIDSPNNFFLDQMRQDKREILRQLKMVGSQKVLDKLMLLFKNGKTGDIGELIIPVATHSCTSNGKSVAASITFNSIKNTYMVCVDHASLKRTTDQETFQLHLISLLTHELVHVWNDDILDPKSTHYQAEKEILPSYFQRLVLKYFSYSHHLSARNSIHKMYNWVAETHSVFRSFKESWESALEVEQSYQDMINNKPTDIYDSKINILCKSYLRDAIFPSEVLYNLDVIRKMFLHQGLIEVPMAAFSHLTNVLRYMTLLKYYCYINGEEIKDSQAILQKIYFNPDISTEEIKIKMLPSSFPIEVTTDDIKDKVGFKQMLERLVGELNYVYMSQKTIPALN